MKICTSGYLLVVEQLLEIIFTLLTLNVPCEAEEPPIPLEGEVLAPAPAPPVALPLPGLVELLGLLEPLAPLLELELELLLASVPMIRI